MKKILSLLLVIAMMVTLAVTVSAEETTTCDLQVADVPVTDVNKDDITAAITAAGGTADGTATYDPVTNTLTLDNFSCSSDAFGGVINIQDGDITIKLKGNNTLSSTGKGTDGIYTNGNLAICNGEDGVAQGQLTINTVSACIAAPSGTLEITDVKVTATSTEKGGLSANSISLSGVTLSATADLSPICTDSKYFVDPETGRPVFDPETGELVEVYGAINIENSTVEAYCASGWNNYAFQPAPTITGTFDVYAGEDAENADKVDAPTDATYTTSKYVKIVPHTSTITVEMADSYGDGWDDLARILALSVPSSSDMEGEEDILGVFTLEDVASGTQTLTIGKNQTVYFFWLFDNEGAYNYEASFTIKRDGVTIYTHADDAEECPLTDWQLLVISEPIDARPTTITYEVAPTFTVTIPATVALGEDVTISADNVVVKKGQQVEVSLTDANGFAVTSAEGAELIYTVKNGDTAVAEGDIVLAVNPKDGKTGSTTLTFVAPTEYTYSGDYTGTVIFTVAVKDVPMISFTFNGTVYQAEEGMTLCRWAESEYDVNDKYFDAGDGTVQVNGSWGFIDDTVIVDGGSYWMVG